MLTGRTNDSLLRNIQDSAYIASIQLENQSFMALLDTGSADTWVVGSDFNCTSKIKSHCIFSSSYKTTSSYSPVKDRKLDVLYSSGERLQGSLGLEKVTLGGVTISNATVGIVHKGSWLSDGVSSGVIGLSAFSGDTRGFDLKTDPENDDNATNIPYEPLITAMYQQNLTAPYFSIALNRPNEGPGALALGGLPGPPIRYENKSSAAKFEYLIFDDGSYNKPGNFKKEYSLYMIRPEGFNVGSRNMKMSVNAILDTGSPLIYVPPDVATAFNKAWIPSAKVDEKSSQWVVNCDAIPPPFGVVINGTTFEVAKEDLAIKGGVGVLPEIEGGKCVSAVQMSGLFSFGVHILGTPFMKNVVSVFDVGAAEMRFLKRIR
jgi:hypothetical protein